MNPVSSHVAVLGAGQMGTGIAYALLQAGYSVTLMDIARPQLDKATGGIGQIFQGAVQLGKTTEDDARAAMGRLHTSDALEDGLRSAPFEWVIESVVESFAEKSRLLPMIDRAVQLGALWPHHAPDIMAGGKAIRAQIARQPEQIGEFRPHVALHARDRRAARQIFVGEVVDHRRAEAGFVIEHVMGDPEPVGQNIGQPSG